jgi:hypothetical protein
MIDDEFFNELVEDFGFEEILEMSDLTPVDVVKYLFYEGQLWIPDEVLYKDPK